MVRERGGGGEEEREMRVIWTGKARERDVQREETVTHEEVVWGYMRHGWKTRCIPNLALQANKRGRGRGRGGEREREK